MAKQGFLWYRSNLLLLLGFTCLSYNSNMQQLNSFVKDPSSNGISSSSPIEKLWFFTKISTIPSFNELPLDSFNDSFQGDSYYYLGPDLSLLTAFLQQTNNKTTKSGQN